MQGREWESTGKKREEVNGEEEGKKDEKGKRREEEGRRSPPIAISGYATVSINYFSICCNGPNAGINAI